MKQISHFLFYGYLAISAGAAVLPRSIEQPASCTNSSDHVGVACTFGENVDLRRRAPTGWNSNTQVINGRVPPASHLSAISRTPTSISLFLTAGSPEARPYELYWSEGKEWQQQSLVQSSGDVSGTNTNGEIGAVSRSSDRAEVFYVSGADSIHSRYWRPDKGWTHSNLLKSNQKAEKYSTIAAVSRAPTSMEIFYVGNAKVGSGSVMHSYTLDDGKTWVVDQVLASTHYGRATLDSLTAISRHADNQQAFWITTDGAIMMAVWSTRYGWSIRQLREPGTAHASSSIAAIAPSVSSMSIFYIGRDLKVYQGYWANGSDDWGFRKVSDLLSGPNAGGVAAVSRNTSHQGVFWTSLQGTVNYAYWDRQTATWVSSPVPGSDSACAPASVIAVASRKGKDTMEGWCRTRDTSKLFHFYYYA